MEKMMHAYIISGSRDAALARARVTAAAALCEGTGEKPCRVCRHCRKIFQGAFPGIHPDVALVERTAEGSSGKPRREIVVSQIRTLALDASVLPNEARGKVYIFPEADTMNLAAQNAFLKLLEEPPAGVMFLLCAENREALLETVRSRCGEIRLAASESVEPQTEESAQRDRRIADIRTRARGYLDVRGDRAELLRCCTAMEKLDSRDLADLVNAAMDMAPSVVKDYDELLSLESFLRRAAEYLRLNVAAKHVTGYLSTYLPDESFRPSR